MEPGQQTEPSGRSTSAVSLIPVSPAELEPFWSTLEPLMIKVIDGMAGRQSMATLLQAIMQQDIQLWAVIINREIKAVIGTQLEEYPTGLRSCVILFAGGSGVRRWIEPVLETLESYAMANDCHRLETYARKGYARHMPDFKLTHVHLQKDL